MSAVYFYYVSSNYPDKGYTATVRKDFNSQDGKITKIGVFKNKDDAGAACTVHYEKAVNACSNFGKEIPKFVLM